jgi:hypothetical protein
MINILKNKLASPKRYTKSMAPMSDVAPHARRADPGDGAGHWETILDDNKIHPEKKRR